MNVLYPSFALVGLTLLIIFRLGLSRFSAIKSGSIDARFFRLYTGYDEPEKLAVQSRHVHNLFETPVLFYVISLAAFVTQLQGMLIVTIAWLYVALRFLHSYVHLTSNNVRVRFSIYLISMLVLLAMWAIVLTMMMRN